MKCPGWIDKLFSVVELLITLIFRKNDETK